MWMERESSLADPHSGLAATGFMLFKTRVLRKNLNQDPAGHP
jgi:hypothetical protein